MEGHHSHDCQGVSQGLWRRLNSFRPRLLKVTGQDGAFRAIVGMRNAAYQPLFLETCLDELIEQAIARKTGEVVGRDCIVEIGNLAESRLGDARLGIIASTMCLHKQDYRWVIFTATPQLLNAFKRVGMEPLDLVVADPERLSEDQRVLWESYYAERPMVCLGAIAGGYASLKDFYTTWLGAKELETNRGSSQSSIQVATKIRFFLNYSSSKKLNIGSTTSQYPIGLAYLQGCRE